MKTGCFRIKLNGLRIAMKTLIFDLAMRHQFKISDIGA